MPLPEPKEDEFKIVEPLSTTTTEGRRMFKTFLFGQVHARYVMAVMKSKNLSLDETVSQLLGQVTGETMEQVRLATRAYAESEELS